ncbi:hypothetical protein P154DRAFT_15308 [Amniculicola lignicola CBS 123094]|uniref:Uncharacterized protein n=1 Tax=Amniculicola lignicola CBS 123094 TaxID=1392246 RepID=A0A6A5X535_9PLEO|nr:hypothetical protein P154DRAFT_15308 [Amniculicola lignicola CBS 123094]
MDPLTIASSVTPTIQLVQNISRFILDFKDASRTTSELSFELRGLQHVISQIQTLGIGRGTFQNDSSSATLTRSLEACRQVLQELEQRQGIDTKSHRFSNRFRGLANPSRQRDTEKLIASLHTHQQELQFFLTVQLVQASSRLNTQLSQKGPASPTEHPSNILSLPEPSSRGVLDWLTSFDYQSRHSELCRVRAPHTGNWFLDSSEFKAWLSGQPPKGTRHRPSNVLWCNGVPGSGKSVLM